MPWPKSAILSSHSKDGTSFDKSTERWLGLQPLFGLCGNYAESMQTTNPTGLTNPYGEPPWAAPHPQSPAHVCKESNAFVSHPHSHNITFAKSPMFWRRGTSNPLYCRQLVTKSANGLCGTMQVFFSSMRNARSAHTHLSFRTLFLAHDNAMILLWQYYSTTGTIVLLQY